jgi:hypothetical protein
MTALESAFNRLESRLQSLIEGSFARLFPSSNWQADLARQMSDALRNGVRNNSGVLFAPDRFTIFLPPEQAILFHENPSLLAILAENLDQAALEAGCRFRARPSFQALPSPEKGGAEIQVVAQFSHEQSGQTDYFVVEQPLAESHSAFLIVDGTRLFPLTDAVTNIGRLSENHLVIQDGRVSRRHAQIRLVQDHYVIFDLGSSGGTFVNNVAISHSLLNPGDVISLAGVPMVFGMESNDQPLARTQKLDFPKD